MEVTYKDIVKGHILKYQDKLTIHGCRYEVCNECFLSGSGCCNDEVFMVLGIDKIKTCKEYGMKAEGIFPFMKSFECLTKLVKALYEMSPFKVGDKVKIKPMTGDADDYPFSYTREMASHAGEIHTITSIEPVTHICKRKHYNGDPHRYHLDFDYCYSWHSSMFELVTRAEDCAFKKESHPEDGGHGVVPVDEERVPEYIPGYSRKTTKTHIIL